MRKNLLNCGGVLALAAALALPGVALASAVDARGVYQWSVRCPSIRGRRAYLWVPPRCRRVRGLVVACQNMLERPLFANARFRRACARDQVAEVLVFPGHDTPANLNQRKPRPKLSYLDIFDNPYYPHGPMHPRRCGQALQKVLNKLAAVSGYSEIRNAPIMPVGHSSAGNFVWYLYRWNPGRIFAMLSFKAGIRTDGPDGIPILEINSEWFDYGNKMVNVSSAPGAIKSRERVRANGNASLFGYYVDIGAGHCNVSNKSVSIIARFMHDTMAARIPLHAPRNALVPLKAVPVQSGWVLNARLLGSKRERPVPDAAWRGDQNAAFWYITKDLAAAVQTQMRSEMAKRPQQIGFVHGGVASTHGGMYSLTPKFNKDGETFRVRAAYIRRLTATDMFPKGLRFGHAQTPILYKVTSGGVVQVGPDTFRVCPHGGPLVPQGNPWEPVIVAYNSGTAKHQPTVHPAHININIFNKSGKPQRLSFPAIANQHVGRLKSVRLRGTATSGLPVEYFVISGPAVVKGSTLQFTRIPVRAKLPMRVLVAAYQWGREVKPQVQSAGPVVRTFLIER